MKPITTIAAACLLIAAPGLHAQGSLTPPPGVPAPVMKTLDQVEARIPLVAGQPGVAINAAGTITISQPGSYYLTGNVTITTASAHGIHVVTNNVTLDLNGFTLICTSVNGGNAVFLNLASNIRVTSGHIFGGTTVSGTTFTLAGWNNGIFSDSAKPGLVATNIDVIGTRNHGISLSTQGARVERCSSDTTGGYGIHASSISFCTARKAGSSAIFATLDPDSSSVDNCFGDTVGSGAIGIYALNGNVSNSRGTGTSGYGITAKNVINSTGVSVSQFGIYAPTATNCSGTSTSNAGIWSGIASNCYGTSNSGIGLDATNATNCVGITNSGNYGMYVSGTASFCQGTRSGGTAISAGIAIGCTSGGGTISSPQKHLGTP